MSDSICFANVVSLYNNKLRTARLPDFQSNPAAQEVTTRLASLTDYVAEILKNATYEKGEQLDVIVAEAPDLPGCITQAATFEEARESLVDAIEVWLMSGR